MARFISNANLVVALLTKRRGYSTAASVIGTGGRGVEERMAKGAKEGVTVDTASSSSWVPDPVTGYYRPANRVGDQMDPAALRLALLSRKS